MSIISYRKINPKSHEFDISKVLQECDTRLEEESTVIILAPFHSSIIHQITLTTAFPILAAIFMKLSLRNNAFFNVDTHKHNFTKSHVSRFCFLVLVHTSFIILLQYARGALRKKLRVCRNIHCG